MPTRLWEPVHVDDDDVFEGEFVVDDAFAWTTSFAVFYMANKRNVTFRNFELRTPYESWQRAWTYTGGPLPPAFPKRGIPPTLRGLALEGQNNRNLTLENVRVRGFPGVGISIGNISGGLIRNVSVEHCVAGIDLSYMGPGSNDFAIENFRCGDTWNAWLPGTDPAWASEKFPGQSIGGPGLAVANARNFKVSGVTVAGENSGVKFGWIHDAEIRHVITPSLMFQGKIVYEDAAQGTSNVLLDGFAIDRSRGALQRRNLSNSLQLSWKNHGMRVRNGILHGGSYNGAAIQLADDVHADIRDCTFVGFNGNLGAAVFVGEGCTLNRDFRTANRFYHQKYVYSTEIPRPRASG